MSIAIQSVRILESELDPSELDDPELEFLRQGVLAEEESKRAMLMLGGLIVWAVGILVACGAVAWFWEAL